MIALAGVAKRWPGGGEAGAASAGLSAVDLRVGAGEFVCLCGPSGCGKTTLLNLIAGLEFPTEGEVLVGGQRVRGPGPDRTVMFQESALFPWLSVAANVAFPLEVAGVGGGERAARVERYLRMVHLWGFRDRQPHTLSGGMRQRVALARALVAEPQILLMDEPFAALDAQTRDVLHAELERVWLETKKTVIFVTHNVREAARLGDRVVIMGTRPGRIKRVLDSKLARPRAINHRDVTEVASAIEDELKIEIEKVIRDEGDSAWSPSGRPVSAGADGGLGDGI